MAITNGIPPKVSAKEFRGRLVVAALLICVAFSLLLARLYYVQILRGEEFADRGRNNFIHKVRTPHDRGIIYDQFGEILVDNRPSLDVEVTPYFLGSSRDKVLETLGELFELIRVEDTERDELTKRILSKRGLSRFRSVMIKRDVSREVVAAIEAERGLLKLNGVSIIPGRRRQYIKGALAAHLLGYVNEIDRYRLDKEKKRGNPKKYIAGDLIGRSGLESQYELHLRGDDGFSKSVVDAKGRPQKESYIANLLEDQASLIPRPGNNLYLTIDERLQAEAELAFDGQAGSVVVLDVRSGAIRALVSVPDFDPNLIGGVLAPETKKSLDENILKPWLNRALQGQYAPGSTFKIVSGLAGLMTKTATVNEKVMCPGYYRIGRYTWRCHKDSGHGMVDLKDALKFSCDTYFYAMAARMGIEPIAEVGRLFGYGARTSILLRGEKRGIMPDEVFHDRVEHKTGGYQKGMALNTSIGQGAVLATPLQVAVSYAAIANGGRILVPQLVSRIETPDFRISTRAFSSSESNGDKKVRSIVEHVEGKAPEVLWEMKPVEKNKLPITPEQLKAIQEGLVAVSQEPGGTAFGRRSRMVSMAGKTGTAQVVRLGKVREKSEDMQYFSRDHAWFASYAPIEEPEIVVVVLNEHSGHGGSKAAPIATKVIDAYFRLKGERGALAGVTEEMPR